MTDHRQPKQPAMPGKPSLSDDPVVLEYERHGFEAALAKPFDVTKLQEVLSQVLGS